MRSADNSHSSTTHRLNQMKNREITLVWYTSKKKKTLKSLINNWTIEKIYRKLDFL